MTRRDVLVKALDKAMQRLYCSSNNPKLTEPEKGHEEEWSNAREEIEILQDMLDEMEG